MKTVADQTNNELADRLIHYCPEDCTAENCDAQQAAKRLRWIDTLGPAASMMFGERDFQAARDFYDRYTHSEFPLLPEDMKRHLTTAFLEGAKRERTQAKQLTDEDLELLHRRPPS